MNVVSKTVITALKSSVLATALFSIVVIGFDGGKSFSNFFPFLFMAIIVNFILSIIGILVTILPFYRMGQNYSLTMIFKRYFPLYAMLIFSICFVIFLLSGFMVATVTLGIAYITAMFAWVWFFRPESV